MKKQLKNKKKIRVAKQRVEKGIISPFENHLKELGEKMIRNPQLGKKPELIHHTSFGTVYKEDGSLHLRFKDIIDPRD